MVTGIVGLNASMYAGLSATGLISGLIAATITMIGEHIAGLKERDDLMLNSAYFLW
ncbi:MAG: hypothetical protein ACI9RU_001859 [Litorivivens sp.]|jgi:hypothetical protein